MDGPDEKCVEVAMLVQCRAPLSMHAFSSPSVPGAVGFVAL